MKKHRLKGQYELLLLSLLSTGRKYGRDLIEILENNNIRANEGTIYPLLSKLQDQGYILSEIEESNTGPDRKYYFTTPDGNKYYNELLHEWNEGNKLVTSIIES